MIITCPHCQTRYQVAREAIGSAGRKVQCAHCLKDWQAVPELDRPAPPPRPTLVAPPPPPPPVRADDDRLFEDMDELGLDDAMIEEERTVTAAERAVKVGEAVIAATEPASPPPAPVDDQKKFDIAAARRQERDYRARQNSLARTLPHARMRRTARIAAFGLLVLVAAGGVGLRTPIVAQFPEMAGLYEAVGLGVNVVGLDFRDVATLRSRHQGAEVMEVNAKIYSVADRPVTVPPVVVTLLDQQGRPIYEWSVSPPTASLLPGETVGISAEVTAPPVGADKVRLTFAGNARLASAAALPAVESQEQLALANDQSPPDPAPVQDPVQDPAPAPATEHR